MRVISLTSAGLLYSHGPGCPGSGLPPVAGSITSVAHQRVKHTSLTSAAVQSDRTSAAQSPDDVLQLLRHLRCRVLKRVPKASRIPAAEKLADTLRCVTSDPDCIKVVDLLTFSFTCFGVPGQRGGQRRLNSLA